MFDFLFPFLQYSGNNKYSGRNKLSGRMFSWWLNKIFKIIFLLPPCKKKEDLHTVFTFRHSLAVLSYAGQYRTPLQPITGFIRGILRGVRYAKSLRVLFLHRRSPSWTTLVLYSRAVFIFNEPTKWASTRPCFLARGGSFKEIELSRLSSAKPATDSWLRFGLASAGYLILGCPR